MAVNNTYYPAYNAYTPLNQAQNTYMAPTQTTSDNGIKWVQGEAGARACAINPGTSAITSESQESTSKIGQTSFVTKDEFEQRLSKLEQLLKSTGGKKNEQFDI